MSNSQGRFLSELRRSNASGLHGNRPVDRYNNNRLIIEKEIAMSVLDEIIPEPTDADLAEIDSDTEFWNQIASEYGDDVFGFINDEYIVDNE